VNSSGKRAFGKIVNQSLLDAFECLSRVVVPIARYFSSDSYGGSVTIRTTEPDGSVRSHSTASRLPREQRGSSGLRGHGNSILRSGPRAASFTRPF